MPAQANERLAVRLDRKIFELPALLENNCQRAARCMHIHTDVSFHRSKRQCRPRCLLLLGIVVSTTQGCPTKPGGTNLCALADLCRSSQTPYPYDAYPRQ